MQIKRAAIAIAINLSENHNMHARDFVQAEDDEGDEAEKAPAHSGKKVKFDKVGQLNSLSEKSPIHVHTFGCVGDVVSCQRDCDFDG